MRAAKAGILGLTWSTANALAKYGITVNAIMPGASTRMTDSIPQGRMPGGNFRQSDNAAGTPMDPANVAPMVAFLASDDAKDITGQAFGARAIGSRVIRIWCPDRVLIGDGPWTVEKLAEGIQFDARQRHETAAHAVGSCAPSWI